jgi:hypothetical protein
MKKPIFGLAALTLLGVGRAARADEPSRPTWGLLEQMHPDDLEAILKTTPVAFVPLGTYEHHGYRLPTTPKTRSTPSTDKTLASTPPKRPARPWSARSSGV